MSTDMDPDQQAAALWGVAENVAFPVEHRLAAALKALEYFGAEGERPMTDGCVFCDPARIATPIEHVRYDGWAFMVFEPLAPVTPGHLLVVPTLHFTDFRESGGSCSGAAFAVAAQVARRYNDANLIANCGEAATQTVFHAHLHVVPRLAGDRLPLPWSRPPVCPICGPGYRLGTEGCRHG